MKLALMLCLLLSPLPQVEEKATVYIYKGWHVNTLWRAAFAVYMNEKMIARLDRGI